MKVVFVCSGNICRSPMAEAYLRFVAAREGIVVQVASAGTLGIVGSPASEPAVRVMAEIGVDLAEHRSQGLERELLQDADWVIGMSWSHLEHLARHHPEGDDRRVLMRAFENGEAVDPNPGEVADPIGRSDEFYREQRQILVSCIEHLLERIRIDVGESHPR